MKKILLPLILMICLVFSSTILATPWDVSTAVYDDKSLDMTAQDPFPYGSYIKEDGTKFYMAGSNMNAIYQYTLSTPFDISTATYDNKNKGVAAQDNTPTDVFFKPDGLIMYVLGYQNVKVFQYTLSTAWDVSTATYATKFKSIAEDAWPTGLFFKPEGNKMYVAGYSNDKVFQYALSTPWDVSTASYENKSCSFEDTFPYDVFFSPNGIKMYEMGSNTDTVYQYSLSTPWDVSTASYDETSCAVGDEDTSPFDVFFKPDGSKMYILGDAHNAIFQYSLPVGWPHEWNTKEISKWNTKEFSKWNDLE